MKKNKVDYVVVGIATILILVVFGIAIFAVMNQSPQSPPPSLIPLPTKTLLAPPQAMVPYDKNTESKLIKKIRNRPTLSASDAEAKESLLLTTLKGYNSGVAYESQSVRIEYVKSVDLFMAEIKTTQITNAKTETTNWFKNKGLSPQGVCDLPIMFLLRPDITQQLDKEDIVFSPLADNC